LRNLELYITLFCDVLPKSSCVLDLEQCSILCLFAILCSFIFFEMKITEMTNEQLLVAYTRYWPQSY